MTRFFTSSEAMTDDIIILTGENAHHARVLRLKKGEQVLVCDGEGHECLCTVLEPEGDRFPLEVLQRREAGSEPKVAVSVYMAFPKADKLEHVIQKATELGAAEIVAFPGSRSVFKADAKTIGKKLERWQKIAASAAEQSGRGVIPEVLVLSSYREALERAKTADLGILFYEHERALTLRMALSKTPYRTVSILTGPEGGLSDGEVEQAADAGLQVCTLGSRILRCETAPLCALSAIMYDAGEF